VPLRSILRYRERTSSDVSVRLLYSSRTLDDVIYRAELDRPAAGVEVIHTLTRHQPPVWGGYARRVDMALLGEVAWPAAEMPLAYACGPTSFVEAVSQALVQSGYPPERGEDRAVRRDRGILMEAVDGNVIGGLLHEVFEREVTGVGSVCGTWGRCPTGCQARGVPAGARARSCGAGPARACSWSSPRSTAGPASPCWAWLISADTWFAASRR